MSPTKGWIAGFGFAGNHLLVTTDGGTTWSTDNNVRTSGTINSLVFVDERNGWVVGGSGSILKYTNADISTSTRDDISIHTMNVFPNPNRGVFNVRVSGLNSHGGKAKITLYNNNGKMINEKITDIRNGRVELEYVLPNLPYGMYFISVNAGDRMMTRKILIQ